jgi:hypothetical protein
LSFGLDVLLQTCDARLFDSAWEWSSRINWFSTLIKFAQLTDWSKAFENKSVGIEACMASGAGGVIAVL